jgi:hypothetical protein
MLPNIASSDLCATSKCLAPDEPILPIRLFGLKPRQWHVDCDEDQGVDPGGGSHCAVHPCMSWHITKEIGGQWVERRAEG